MKIPFLLAVTAIAGCASTSAPVAVGPDTYTLSISQMGGMKSHGSVRADALRKANEHCGSLGKTMVLQTSESSGARGWTPIEEAVTYRCQ
ncbi:hypothetical protein [Cognatiluteimonas profundi]|uniref:hypothetical protein n=1 Tax=Cognatiluteimonas profundi TaxID=2594501 RepID=UPI00131DE1E0|nr:hypothetical protein [Lysobacter profundi]